MTRVRRTQPNAVGPYELAQDRAYAQRIGSYVKGLTVRRFDSLSNDLVAPANNLPRGTFHAGSQPLSLPIAATQLQRFGHVLGRDVRAARKIRDRARHLQHAQRAARTQLPAIGRALQ